MMLKKKYYDGFTVHDILNKHLDDGHKILELLTAFADADGVDAVPVEFVMDNYNSEFVCDALTDDGDWCSEHCEFSEAQPECIHRYIERIWSAERKEHD